MKKFLPLLMLLAGICHAQTPATVTGTIYATNGALATSGYVEFDIAPAISSVQYYVSGTAVIAPLKGRCGINSSGQVKNLALSGACTVWGNDVVTPGNTTYTIIYAPGNTAVSTVARHCITGSSYNLNSPVFCPVVNIVPQYQTITTNPIQVNLVPAANSVFNVGSSGIRWANGYFTNFDVLNSFNVASSPIATSASLNTFTNKTFDTAGAGNVFKINSTQVTDKTGTGKMVLDTNPAIVSPTTTGTDTGSETFNNKAIDTANGNTLKVGGVDVGTSWTAYTPTLACAAGSLTSASASGRSKQIGKTVYLSIHIHITTLGTCSSFITATVPFTGVTNVGTSQVLLGRESAVAGFVVDGFIVSGGTTMIISKYDNSFAGGDGFSFELTGVYESQ